MKMSVTLAQLCVNAEKKYGLKLIAGAKGTERAVRWIHMTEDGKDSDFLHGGELVFTTGIGHIGSSWLEELAVQLCERGAAGLVVNLGPYIAAVPSKVIVYCEEHGFPLFTLPWDTYIIDITYSFCRKIISSEKNEASAAEAFTNLIFSPDAGSEYTLALERLGFRENSSYTVLVLGAAGKNLTEQALKTACPELCRQLRKSRSASAMFINSGRLICVRQNLTKEEMLRISVELSEIDPKTELIMGISEPHMGYGFISECYEQAAQAFRAAAVRGEKAVHYRDIGALGLLFAINDKKVIKRFCDSVLGALSRYDEINGSDCEKTLLVYLESNCSLQKTAEILGIHRNTVNYKIKNIKALLGTEFSNEDKMNLMLAYRAKQLIGEANPPEIS